MANYFYLVLDTTAPASPVITIENGNIYATQQLVNIQVSTTDSDKTGYQMKIWGNVDDTFDTNVKTTEATSSWITFNPSKQIKLATGDGSKTIYCKIRDDVFNESAEVSDSITLDTTIPIVTINGGDVPKISKISGHNVCAFSFQADCDFVEYKVKVVQALANSHDTGTLISTTNGSTNMSSVGAFTKDVPINCTINGTDLETASAGDGQKIIKVFVKDSSGLWSV